MTVREFEIILAGSIDMEWLPQSHDVLLAGSEAAVITGIAVVMTATFEALEQAVERRCNLILTHEPLFWDHSDKTDAVRTDPVFRKKLEFVESRSLNVFRFHDHMHRTPTDMIAEGMAKTLGWESFAVDAGMKEFAFGEKTLSELTAELGKKLPAGTIRSVGKPELKSASVLTSWGFAGRDACIALLNSRPSCILIVGETHEWELAEYVRDAVHTGEPKGLLVTGHIPSEEAAMAWFALRLGSLIPDPPVVFIGTGSPFGEKPPR